LRKEKEEERQLQELQRLQEEQTGKKRTEKLEWMYATPATGSAQNPNDLEDYLLGKKRVDKMLTADEKEKVCLADVYLSFNHLTDFLLQVGAAHKNFIAVQNANNARDIAAKIREDPLLAIKQQEQAAYQALLSNPLRLAKMQKELGVNPKKDKKEKKREKEERRRLKHERRNHKGRDSRSTSPSRWRTGKDRPPVSNEHHRLPHPRSPRYRSSSRSRSPGLSRRRDAGDPFSRKPRRYSPYRGRSRSRSRTPIRDLRSDSEDHLRPTSNVKLQVDRPQRFQSNSRAMDTGKRSRSPNSRQRSPPPKRICHDNSNSPPPPRTYDNYINRADQDRAARLAAMSSNANSMSEDRQKRLAALLEKEKAELEADERARAKSKGMSGFLSHEQKRVFGGVGGLEDRIKRGRGGLVVDAD